MSDIETNLQTIINAVHGRDVRQAIHDAIHDCYEDGKAGATDLVARERISEIVTDSTGTLSGYSVQTEKITLGTLNQSGDKYNYTGSKTFSDDVTIIDVVAYSSGYGAGIPISYKYENKVLTATATVTFEFQAGVDATIVYLQSEPISLTELTDIRVGEDGTVYDTAGDAVREQISDLKSQISSNQGLTAEFKTALENLVSHVAFSGDDPTGRTYINALHTAMYPPANLTRIEAVYTQSGTVYNTDSLDSLKSDLVVTARFDDGSSEVVASYALSGTLTSGTSVITVTYGGKTTTFNVTVSADPTVYTLTNKVFANDGATDSGIAYLSDGDKAFSIMCDATFSEQTMRWSLFKMMNPTSPWAGILFGQANAVSDYAMVQWMTIKTASSGSSAISLARSYTGRVRVVFTHALGSDSMTYYVKIGSAQIIQRSLSGTFANVTGNLAIGGTLSGTEGFNGTVNSFKMYDYVLNQTKIDDFFA